MRTPPSSRLARFVPARFVPAGFVLFGFVPLGFVLFAPERPAAGEGLPEVAAQVQGAPDCALTFLATEKHEGFVDERERVSRMRLRLWYSDPATSVRLVSPYYGSAHSDIRSIPRPLAFLGDFSSARSGAEGRVQWMTISWMGELELAISTPGCPPVPLRCDERTCTG